MLLQLLDQHQIQLLLGQVQHLNGLSDMQAQRIQGMSDYEAMKTAVIQMQQQQTESGLGAPNRYKFLVDRKEVKVDNFFGEEAKFGDFVEGTKMYSDIVYPELGGEQDGPFGGKSVVFTGTLEEMTRAEAKRLVERLGGRVVSASSKQIDFLIAGDKAGSKRKKAEELGVTVLDEEQFLELVR